MNENSSNLASLGKRFVGALIDGVIVLAIIFPVMFATGVFQRGFQGQRTTATEHVVYSAAGIILFFILNGYLLIKRGQTIGKVVMKTKIVDLNGNIPNFGKIIILRYLLFKLLIVIPFIGRFVGLINILFILGKERRCLHDYAAGTIVINA